MSEYTERLAREVLRLYMELGIAETSRQKIIQRVAELVAGFFLLGLIAGGVLGYYVGVAP